MKQIPKETLQRRAELTTKRDQARHDNIRTWVQHSDHPENLPSLNKVPDTLLKELYPALWSFGPRGDIYMRQLDRIETLLDETHYDIKDNTFLIEFPTYFAGFNNDAGSHPDILDEDAANRGLRLSFQIDDPIAFNNPDEPGSRQRDEYLTEHIIWEDYPTIQPQFVNFLERFTIISLHLDYLRTCDYAYFRALTQEYDMLCNRWEIPT